MIIDTYEYQKVEKGLEGGTNMKYRKAILDREAISKRIRNIIASSSLTHDDLAELLEFNSSRVIYDWENGKKLPNIENFYNLLLIFKIEIEDLLVFK